MRGTGAIAYRPTTPDDVAALHGVFCRAMRPVVEARGYDWEDPPLEQYSLGPRHLLTTDPDRCWVAESRGQVLAYTSAFVRDSTWFFASLFIDPQLQGRGVGKHLFALAVDDAPQRRLTITDSIQPISNALYGRNGLLPIAPLVRFVGAGTLGTPELELADTPVERLTPIDRAAYGFGRGVDHRYWALRGDRHVWRRHGEPVAWAYRWANGNIGPLAAIDASTAAAALRSELALGGAASIEAPASARSIHATALGAGLRITPPIGLLLASDGVEAPTSLAIGSYGLY